MPLNQATLHSAILLSAILLSVVSVDMHILVVHVFVELQGLAGSPDLCLVAAVLDMTHAQAQSNKLRLSPCWWFETFIANS